MKVIEYNGKRKNGIETVEFTLPEKFVLIAVAVVLSLFDMNRVTSGNAGGIAFASYVILLSNFVIVWAIVYLLCIVWARKTGRVQKVVA